MGKRHRVSLVTALLCLLLGAAACSTALGRRTQFGHYRARSADGHYVTVTLDAQRRRARLGWTGNAGSGSLPATISFEGGRIVLILESGLTIDEQITGNNRFQLTYSQNADGEPETGRPIRTLDFALASVS